MHVPPRASTCMHVPPRALGPNRVQATRIFVLLISRQKFTTFIRCLFQVQSDGGPSQEKEQMNNIFMHYILLKVYL